MLILCNAYKKHLEFSTYRALYNHLVNLERCKGKGHWVFERHPWVRMMSCYRYIRSQKLFPSPFQEIFEQDLEKVLEEATGKNDILEIIRGNPKQVRFIPITPDTDVEALRQRWCQKYCKTHNYALFNAPSLAVFEKRGGEMIPLLDETFPVVETSKDIQNEEETNHVATD